MTSPNAVGTAIRAPSTASDTLTGISTWMSRPSRRNRGCGSMWISIRASPAGRPARPGSPCPLSRSTCPSSMPGGDADIERAAIRQGEPRRGSGHRVKERHGKDVGPVASGGRCGAALGVEELAEDVAEIVRLVHPAPPAPVFAALSTFRLAAIGVSAAVPGRRRRFRRGRSGRAARCRRAGRARRRPT